MNPAGTFAPPASETGATRPVARRPSAAIKNCAMFVAGSGINLPPPSTKRNPSALAYQWSNTKTQSDGARTFMQAVREHTLVILQPKMRLDKPMRRERMPEKITPREIEPFCSVEGCHNDGMHLILGRWYCFDHGVPPSREEFDEFMAGARELVEGKAKEKGYNETGTGKNDLMEFTNKFFPGHAGGEIVYKAIRYGRKRDKSDLLKIAAWAYLLWRYDS